MPVLSSLNRSDLTRCSLTSFPSLKETHEVKTTGTIGVMKMKLGFFGNMNCLPFGYASELKKRGHDVRFFVDTPQTDILMRPENYYDEISYPYPDWIHEFEYPRNNLLCFSFPRIFLCGLIQKLNACDAVFLNLFGHALAPSLRADMPKVSVCSGADLDVLCRTDDLNTRAGKIKGHPLLKPLRNTLYRKWMNNHRRGIALADVVDYFPRGVNPIGEKILSRLKGGGYDRWELRGIDVNRYPYLEPPDNEMLNVFCGVRSLWKEPFPSWANSFQNKGNDVIIEGLAAFYAKTQIPFEAHIVNKGACLDELKKMSWQLGIGKFIHWFDPVPAKELPTFYRRADICFEQCGKHWVGAVGWMAMLHGRPLIANARPDVFDRLTGPSPICHATSADDVCNWMLKLATDRDLRIEKGRQSREYMIQHFGMDNALDFFEEKIEALLKTN